MRIIDRLARKVKAQVIKTVIKKTLGSIPSIPNSLINRVRDYLLRKPKKENKDG